MKIALIIDLWSKGGGNIFVKNLSKALREENHEVEVLCDDESLCTTKIPFSERGSLFRLISALKVRNMIKKELDRISPDVVLILSPLAALAFSKAISEDNKYKSIYAPRYLALDHWKNIEGGLSGGMKWIMEKGALTMEYSQIFALSENMKDRIKKAGAKSSIKIVPIGVDTEKFKPLAKETERSCILFAGRFEPVKGIDVLIEASKHFDTVKFLVVGDNVEKLGDISSNVEAGGRVPHQKMVDLYNEALAVALPSYSEGLPRVCLEALACATPVIASRVGGVPELVIDGETGILIEPGSVEQLIGGIDKLLKDPELAEEMGKKGRAHIVKNYRKEKTMERTIKALLDN